MGMVERSEELRALEDMLDAARGGTGSVVLVEGAAGVGKTALLHALAECATASGAVFAGASASSLERNMPLATVGQIFEERVLSGDERARAGRLLRDGALTAMAHGHGAPSGAPVALPPLVLGGLSDILLGLADRTPVVIGADDVQHFDELSRQVLLYVARRVRSARILLVATGCPRTGADASSFSFHADLPRLSGAHRLRLEPLSLRGTEAVIEERLGRAAARRLADEAHRATGGNPLLVRALVEDQRGRADDAESPVFASAFRQAVLYCLQHSGLARFAAGLAALGDRVGDAPRADAPRHENVRSAVLSPTALVGELLRLDAESTGEHRERLASIGLLGASGLCHEAVETAVLRSLPGTERSELLSRAAEVLYGRGAPGPVVADRLMAADRLDGPWGVQVLCDAAEHAQAEGRFALAVDQLRLALREAAGDEARHAARFALARAECRLDPSIAARHLPALVRALHDRPVPDEEGTAFVVGLLLWLGRSTEALNLVAEPVPAEARSFADPSGLDGPIAGRYWWLPDAYPGLVGRGPFPSAGRTDPPGGDLQALSVPRRLLAGGVPGHPAAPGRRARLLADAAVVLQDLGAPPASLAVGAVLVALLHIDELERVEAWCDDGDKAAQARPPFGTALAAALRAKIHLRRGELVEAEQRAREALDIVPPAAWGVAVGIPLAALLAALTRLGDLAEAQRVLNQPVPPAMWDTPAVLPYLRARGRYHLAMGAPRAALAEFHACGELMRLWEMDLPSLVPWRTDAAEAHLRLGETAAARLAAQEQLDRLAHGGARTRGITLHVLALASPAEERPRLLTEAIQLLEQAGDRLERAKALSALSDAYRVAGHDGTARALWRRADLLFAECGADGVRRTLVDGANDRALADGAYDGGREATPVHDPLVELSDAERRVAEYAANGYTNRQIARRLHVTMSTVEQHLTRVYRKLSITRRTDLPLRLTMPREEFTA